MSSKLVETHVAELLSVSEVARVLQKAQRAFPTFKERLPQDISLSASCGPEWLPALADVSGVTVERTLDLSFDLRPDQVSAQVLARVAGDLQAACDEKDGWGLRCRVRLPADPSSARPMKDGELRLWGGDGEGLRMTFSPYAYPLSSRTLIVLVPRPDPNSVPASYWADERRRALAHFTTWARSARLPLQFAADEERLSVQRTDGGQVEAELHKDLGGPAEVRCPLQRVEAHEAGERLHAAVSALHARRSPGYSGSVWAPASRGQQRACQQVYAALQSAAWPAASGSFHARLRVQTLAGLDALRRFRHSARQGLRVVLAEFKGPGEGRRSHLIRLLDRARPDGHHLSLRLRSDDLPELPRIARQLSVSFRP